eukprot:CAMPEP_0180431016 /NCGR_PEP_ID=MMETSP1036_2-20121128/8184_1 /TAXON_ID=632150 /ORGANISM="Azadinium spinosum, Strain 3D9" /LENGTH=83 /DNA_ID=CAMNT_0022436769 /DNA_START=423 /DNA_END=674 /DNA_ORIENTATION=+
MSRWAVQHFHHANQLELECRALGMVLQGGALANQVCIPSSRARYGGDRLPPTVWHHTRDLGLPAPAARLEAARCLRACRDLVA